MIDCIEDTTHCRDKDGYARVWYGGKMHLAHRATFHAVFGWWPPVVRHRCDNPPCVNIWHLLPGTVADNIRDAVERGRFVQNVPPPAPTLNHGMPDQRTDRAAYKREQRRRQAAGEWVYRA